MFKRVLLGVSGGLLLASALLLGLQIAQGRGLFAASAANKRADQFREVLRLVHENYVDGNSAAYDKLAETALEEMLRSLDPHSEFLSRREFDSFKEDTSQEFGGIGVQIEMRDNHLTVVAPIDGTPGARAGLLRGDQFLKVEDRDVVNLPLEQCLNLLRGKPGSPVSITLFRPRTGETLTKVVNREIIKVESVRDVHMLQADIGYVRVLQFGERTGEEFVAALETLEKQGMKALVLDLRDNPGGLLDVAVDVAEPFFNRGELVVYTQGKKPETREDILARSRDARRNYPVAVLINSGSASAAEIVAGALRDTGRAVLVGEKSFGKGSVQTIFPVGGEAIRLTTARYYLPSGAMIHGHGIAPHIPVTLTAEEDRKLVIQRNRLNLMTPEEFRDQFEFEPIEDRQLSAAVDALRGVFAVAALSRPES